ncbi:hypothetical protein VTK73DRAFT_3747 [Phialemonium thermophilum]|uniref:Uncharacterized protein n=1 Tax=Phialemonium thermophilum TaxID=223376 RepID=A0ABR3WXA7_9PEZI
MFELPQAKRVRREELQDSASSEGSEIGQEDAAAIESRLKSRLADLLSFEIVAPVTFSGGHGDSDAASAANRDAEAADVDREGEVSAFEFPLFSTGGSTSKVVLAPDDDLEGGTAEGGIVSERPISFYVRGELSPEEHDKFRYAALEFRDLMAAAQKRAWGLERPWKVIKITVASGGSVNGTQHLAAEGKGKKKRPGKKRRIALRTREKAQKEREAELEKQRAAKEEHLKEKKKRLNREKKLRRRRKEKEKKLTAKTDPGASNGQASSTDSSDSE